MNNLIPTFRQIWMVLDVAQRRRLYTIFGLIGFNSFLEGIGVASIMPFLALVANPDLIERNQWLHRAYLALHFKTSSSFTIAFGLALLAHLIFKNTFGLFVTWWQARFWRRSDTQLGTQLLYHYLHLPYRRFLELNTSQMYRTITADVGGMMATLNNYLILMAEIGMALFIVAALFVTNPVASLTVLGGFAAILGIVQLVLNKRVTRLSRDSHLLTVAQTKTGLQSLSAAKDLQILDAQGLFVRRYYSEGQQISRVLIKLEIGNGIPKVLIETLAFGVIILFVVLALASGRDLSQAMPLIGMYVFAGYKLMPSLNRMIISVLAIQRYVPAIKSVTQELNSRRPASLNQALDRIPHPTHPPLLKVDLEFKNLVFSYRPDEPVLNGISLRIPRGKIIGLTGPSGGGKSTLVDVLLGLLKPDSGQIEIDGLPADLSSAIHRQLFSYVPQSVFLLDDTITRNIALGIDDEDIDFPRIKEAARIAQIDLFIDTLQEGYSTVVGERGVRLSGGQRQRIGIARAMYRRAPIIVLDESTSALDGITESEYIKALMGLREEHTVLIIAHRISTLRDCDQLYFLKSGKIISSGSHQELFNQLPEYRDVCNAMSVQ